MAMKSKSPDTTGDFSTYKLYELDKLYTLIYSLQ